MDIPAHSQHWTHKYVLNYPAHGPRIGDPHYIDFEAHRKRTRPTAVCWIAERIGLKQCHGNLELHHAYIEFSLTNGVSFKALEKDFPGISDPDKVGAWVESDQNFRWLCENHHRGMGAGAHSVDHAAWNASAYVPGLTE